MLGTVYDIQFVVDGTYNSIYAGTPSPFLADVQGGTAAVSAIKSALMTAGVDGVLSFASALDYWFVPTSISSDSVGIMYGFINTDDNAFGGPVNCGAPNADCHDRSINHASLLPDDSYNWVVFTASQVPLPGTVALVALGLLGLRLNRRSALR